MSFPSLASKFLFKLHALSFRTKVFFLIGWAMLLATFLSSYAMYEVAMKEATRQLGHRLQAIVVSGSMLIDGDAHKMLTEPSQMESGTYLKFKRILQNLQHENDQLRLRFVYTMAPTEKPGYWRYVVDSEPADSKYFSPLGVVEDFTYDKRWMKAIEQPLPDEKLEDYRDWGYLLSASAPIRDMSGKPVGVLSVDAEPDDVMKALLSLRLWGLGFLVFGVLLALFTSFVISKLVTKPIFSLIKATQAVAQGNFEHYVHIPNRSEITLLADAFNKMTAGLKERDMFKNQFERYVSHQVAKKILAQPQHTFWMAERRRVTVLFCDIRGFTSMAEDLDPANVINFLNSFFSEMIDIVFEHEGTLDKFMGDALMAIFGAPYSPGKDEERAVRTAVSMLERARALSLDGTARGLPPFQVGIGINTGEVVTGNIGSERRMEYTAIGDHVNLAARLEKMNRQHNTSILISETTYQAVSGIVEARLIGTETIRGRHAPINVYEVLGLKTKPEAILAS